MLKPSFTFWATIVVIVTILVAATVYPAYFPSHIEIAQEKVFGKGHIDTLALAVQFGRLDFISYLLTVLGIMLGMGAMVGFSYYGIQAGRIAAEVAEEEAKKIAKEVAAEVAEETTIKELERIHQKKDLDTRGTMHGAERTILDAARASFKEKFEEREN